MKYVGKENDVQIIKKAVKERLKAEGTGNFGLKIFEITGNAHAQLKVLKLVTERKFMIEPYIEKRPMSEIKEAFKETKQSRLKKWFELKAILFNC